MRTSKIPSVPLFRQGILGIAPLVLIGEDAKSPRQNSVESTGIRRDDTARDLTVMLPLPSRMYPRASGRKRDVGRVRRSWSLDDGSHQKYPA
jgi:hypothetical protein